MKTRTRTLLTVMLLPWRRRKRLLSMISEGSRGIQRNRKRPTKGKKLNLNQGWSGEKRYQVKTLPETYSYMETPTTLS